MDNRQNCRYFLNDKSVKARHILPLLLLANAAQATPITSITVPINLGPARLVHLHHTSIDIDFPSSFPLNGQMVSLTFTFNTNVRVFRTTQDFFVNTLFDTNGSSIPPSGGPAQASLLDQSGNELVPPVEALFFGGSAFVISFHPNFGDYLPLDQPVDFYGVRYDFTAPNMPGSTITSSVLRLGASRGTFGIGIVPDAASTLLLLSLSLGSLLAAARCTRQQLS